jgi:integrase
MAMLRKLANWAADHGYCDAPGVRWKLPVGRSRKAAPVSEAEYRKLLENANPVQKAILTWYWETGCRPSELVAIRRADFDRKTKLVTIPTSKTGKRTGRPTRQFPLEKPELIRVIRERNAWLRAVRNRKESTPGFAKGDVRARLSSEWLFPGRSGAQIATGGYAEALWSCYKRAGISKIDIIGFRHAFATRFLQKGADPLTLAKLMGTSMSMIERTYGHLMMDHARAVIRRMK